jgi:hypothetical protein
VIDGRWLPGINQVDSACLEPSEELTMLEVQQIGKIRCRFVPDHHLALEVALVQQYLQVVVVDVPKQFTLAHHHFVADVFALDKFEIIQLHELLEVVQGSIAHQFHNLS